MTKEKTLKLLNLNKIEDLGHQKYIFRLTLKQQKEVWKHFGDYLNDKWEMNTCYECGEIDNTYCLAWNDSGALCESCCMEKCNHTEQLKQNIDIYTEKAGQKEYIICSICSETLGETN